MNEMDRIRAADEALLATVDEAIERAAKAAVEELQSLGVRTSPRDYFADAVLRHMFLRLCGADPQSRTGGDPELAWKILYMGRSVARHWERERGDPEPTVRRKKDRQEDIARDESERRQLAQAAQNLAMKTAIRVLIDHARASDPQIGDRLDAAVEARHDKLDTVSDTDRAFNEYARNHMAYLTASPEQAQEVLPTDPVAPAAKR